MASCGNLKLNFMKNIDINEWLLNNNIDPLTEIFSGYKQWFLSDILEKHLKEQFAIHGVIKSLPEPDEIRMKARELDEKDFAQWMYELQKGNVL